MSDSMPPRRQPFGYGKSGSTGSGKSPSSPKRDKPAFEVVEDESDFEVVEEEPAPKKKSKRVEPEPVDAEADEEHREKPRARKKKKKGMDSLSKQLLAGQDEDQQRRDAALRSYEYTIPFVLLVIGVILSVVGAFGAAKGVSGIFTIGVLSAFVAVYVPLAIGALMVIGVLLGINYGRLWPAILKMAAITFIVNGIWLFGDWIRAPALLIFPLCCFISFGLFMTQFDLDTWETNASVGVLNLMTFAANMILIGFLVVAASSTSDKGSDPDDDSPPAEKQKKRDRDRDKLDGPLNPGPAMDPDDDDDN